MRNDYETEPNLAFWGTVWVILIVSILGGLISGGMYGCPKYNVYSSRLAGEAMLAHAQAAKEVAVADAKARMESADHLAEAEIKRARGVAEANKIIGESLKNNDAYLRYLWITGLEAGAGRETVYIPTEAGLPILEANRFNRGPKE